VKVREREIDECVKIYAHTSTSWLTRTPSTAGSPVTTPTGPNCPVTMAGIRLGAGRTVKGMIDGEMLIAFTGIGPMIMSAGCGFNASRVRPPGDRLDRRNPPVNSMGPL
jgi:hypothetical protein